MGQGSLAVICVECKKSVERSFGAIKTLIIHKMLAGLLGVWHMVKACLGLIIFLLWCINILTIAYSVCHVVMAWCANYSGNMAICQNRNDL